jgi:hypothetical protein
LHHGRNLSGNDFRKKSPTESYPRISFFPRYRIELEHKVMISPTVTFSSLKETMAITPLKIPRECSGVTSSYVRKYYFAPPSDSDISAKIPVPSSHHQLPPHIQFVRKIMPYEDLTLFSLGWVRPHPS